MCSVAYLCIVSPTCGNDLFVVVVCILVRKRAGPWKIVAAYENVTSKCDNSTVCTWSKANGRVGPRHNTTKSLTSQSHLISQILLLLFRHNQILPYIVVLAQIGSLVHV